MAAPSPDASSPGELEALRERAYGAHADIDADPAALARLHELEAAAPMNDVDQPRATS